MLGGSFPPTDAGEQPETLTAELALSSAELLVRKTAVAADMWCQSQVQQ